MIVCVCHRVNDRTLAQRARQGMSFDDVQLDLGVGTQCGKCATCARALWQECQPSNATAHLHLNTQHLEGRAWHTSQHLASL